MNITPDQASELIYGATHGPWTRTTMGALMDTDGEYLVRGPDGNMHNADANLAAAAPDLAATIAGLTWQWAVKVGDRIEQMNDRAMAEDAIDGIEHGTLVCRLVSEWEVTDGDHA